MNIICKNSTMAPSLGSKPIPPAISLTVLVLASLLFFIWPIANNTATRNVLLLVTLLLGGYVALGLPRPTLWASLRLWRTPLTVFGLLLCWSTVVSLCITDDIASSFNGIRKLWVMSVLAGLVGVIAGNVARHHSGGSLGVILLLLIPLTIHLLIVDGLWCWELLRHGTTYYRSPGLTSGPDKGNLLTNMTIAMLFAGTVAQLQSAALPKLIPAWVWTTIALLAAVALYVARTRNGIAVVAVMAVASVWIWLFSKRATIRPSRQMLIASAVTGLVVAGLALWAVNSRSDTDWKKLADTVEVALDTEGHIEWRNPSESQALVLADGRTADMSLYLRLAWAKEGLLLVLERPLGTGVGKDQFGAGVSRKYQIEYANHSHSGLLDVAISIGIPGAVLWLGFVITTGLIGLRQYRATQDPFALAVFFVTLDFGARMIIDSIVRDHMLQQFFFVIGVLSAMVSADGTHATGTAGSNGSVSNQSSGLR